MKQRFHGKFIGYKYGDKVTKEIVLYLIKNLVIAVFVVAILYGLFSIVGL